MRKVIITAISAVTLFACGSATSPTGSELSASNDGEKTASAPAFHGPSETTEVMGTIYFDGGGCSAADQAFIEQIGQYGRIAATTPAFEQCISNAVTSGTYMQCNGDPLYGASQASQIAGMIAMAQSPDAVTMACDDVDPNAPGNAWAGISNIGDNYSQREAFTWGPWFESVEQQMSEPLCSSTVTTNCRFAAYPWPYDQAAGIMWHEASHQHGYTHGANDQANAIVACGYAGNTTWNFQWNTAPYIIQNCITQVIDQSSTSCNTLAGCPTGALNMYNTTTSSCSCVEDPNMRGFGVLSLGSGGFTTEQVIPDGTAVSGSGFHWTSGTGDVAVATADFDGDGNDDILVQSGWGIGILKRASATAYEAIYVAPIGTVMGSWRYEGDTVLEVGDFDGNGKADILVKSGWGMGILSLNSSNQLASTWLAPYGTTVGKLQLQSSTTVLGNAVYRGKNGDFDGDGHVDILVRGAAGIGLLQQTPGTGAIYSKYYAPFGTSTAGSNLGGWEFSSTDTVGFVGDFHNASKAEVMIRSGWGMGTLGVTSAGSFTATSLEGWGTKLGTAWTTASTDSFVAVGDYNGDGLSDLLVRNAASSDGILFSAGASSLEVGVGVMTSGGWRVGTGDQLFGGVGDLDGNGTEDIFVQSGWGVAVLSASGGTLVSKAVAAEGSLFGDWLLGPTDFFWTAGKLDGTTHSELLLRRSAFAD